MRISIYELGTNDGVEMITYYHLWSSTQHDPAEVRRILRWAFELRPDKEIPGEIDDGASGDEKVSAYLQQHDLHPFAVHDLRDDMEPPPIPMCVLNNRLDNMILFTGPGETGYDGSK